MSATPEDLLATYLNDHLAGATGGLELARRLARNHQGTQAERITADLADQIAQDRVALLEIMNVVGVRPRKLRLALAMLTERASRLKLNGALLRRSPLSSLIELEAMRLGVEGKTDGWQTLRHLADHDRRVDPDPLDELLHRARNQSHTLQDLRRQAAADAFKSPTYLPAEDNAVKRDSP